MAAADPVAAVDADRADDGRLAIDRKLIYIDTLRGCAILMVIVVHHSQRFDDLPAILQVVTAYCQTGVQLFFVASAFTLCNSAALRRQEPSPLVSFFIRRYFRIAPLYYVGLVFYALMDSSLRYLGFIKGPTVFTSLNVISNLFFVHGFVPGAFNSVVPGGWSIATEMTFYALFPVLFAGLQRLHRRAGLGSICAVIAGVLAVDAAFQLAVIAHFGEGIANNNIFYCSIINQLPVFMIGMAGYLAIRHDRSFRPDPLRDALGFAGFTLLAIWLMNAGPAIPMIFLPSVSAVAFLFLLNLARRFVHQAGLIEKIGQVSFSMYIFHFVFAWWMTKFIVSKMGAIAPAMLLYVVTLTLTILFTYGAATITKLLIEDRFIDYGRRWIRRRDARHAKLSVADRPY